MSIAPWLLALACGAILLATGSWNGALAYAVRVAAVLGLAFAGILLLVGALGRRRAADAQGERERID